MVSKSRKNRGIACLSLLVCTLVLLIFSGAALGATTDTSDWSAQKVVLTNTAEAQLMVRVGDIDNLGFGWPQNYDPFSGKSTPRHNFPWTALDSDTPGTDRIMVVTSYNGHPPYGQDGYTGSTRRPENTVRPISLQYDLSGITVNEAVLQMFVDDFQATVWHANYQVFLNGTRAPFLESVLNTIVQTGPIGKLISVQVPDEFLPIIQSGDVQILIDDTTTGAGDGYAIDFVKLLVNPVDSQNTGIIKGKVVNKASQPIIGAIVTAQSGIAKAITDSSGNYVLNNVYAGLVNLKIEADGYISQTANINLEANQTQTLNVTLESLKTPPVLMAVEEKYVGDPVDITFTDDSAWRSAVTGITVDGTQLQAGQYTLTAGNISIAEGVLNVAGDHTILVSATDYKNTSVIQTMNLKIPPALNADDTDNYAGASVDIGFDDDGAWSTAITGITVDGTELTDGQYTVSAGNINITEGILVAAGDHEITVLAEGYEDDTVTQPMIELMVPPTLTPDSEGNYEGASVDISFDDDGAWSTAITGITVDGTELTDGQYTISAGNIIIAEGLLATAGDYTILVSAAGYEDADVIQPIEKEIVPSVTLDDNVVYVTSDPTYVTMKILGTFTTQPGYEIVEQGFISIKNPATPPGDDFTLNTSGITVVKVPKTNSAGQAYRSIKTTYGSVFYVRGYVTYKNTVTGKAATIYSDDIVEAVKTK